MVATWWLLGKVRCASRLFFCAPCLGREHFFKFERTKAANLGQLGPTCCQCDPTWANLTPISSNFGLASAIFRQFSINLGHLGPNMGHGTGEKSLFSICVCVFLKYRPSCNLKSTWTNLDQLGANFVQNLCQLGANSVPTWWQLGAKLRQLGVNVEPTGPNLGLIWARLGPT